MGWVRATVITKKHVNTNNGCWSPIEVIKSPARYAPVSAASIAAPTTAMHCSEYDDGKRSVRSFQSNRVNPAEHAEHAEQIATLQRRHVCGCPLQQKHVPEPHPDPAEFSRHRVASAVQPQHLQPIAVVKHRALEALPDQWRSRHQHAFHHCHVFGRQIRVRQMHVCLDFNALDIFYSKQVAACGAV